MHPLILTALFINVLYGQKFGCPYGSEKRSPECTLTSGPFHVTCDSFPLSQAHQACIDLGYQLAQITEQNLFYAQNMLPNCVYDGQYLGAVWVGSQNGLMADPCMLFHWNRTVALESGRCEEGRYQVMCEELVTITDTLSTTTTTTVTFGVRTSTTTVSWFTQATQPWEDLIVEKKQASPEQCRPCESVCLGSITDGCNCCSDACPASAKGLHLVPADSVFYWEADAVCRKNHWRLADYTSGMAGIITTSLLRQCYAGQSVAMWVRSVNGVGGFECLSVNVDVEGRRSEVSVIFGHTDLYCQDIARSQTELLRLVLCQEECELAVTGYGPGRQWTSTITSSVITTTTTTTPSSTTTITSTVTCRQHRVMPYKRPKWIPKGVE